MRDYVRGKGWVGAKDGKPVNPTTGQPRVFQQVNCPECKKRITVEVLGVPPAADAGPRQLSKFTVGVCDNPIHRFDPEVQTKHIKLDNCVNWVAIRPAAPPAPQEAAPPEVLTRKELIAEIQELKSATAPDSAMRVAREIKSMLVRWIDYEDTQYVDPVPIAALIREREFCEGCDHGVVAGKVCELCGGTGYKERRREAGRQRERRLEDGLKHVLQCSDGSPHTCTKCAEASRIMERK
jgi:hypothetical protein